MTEVAVVLEEGNVSQRTLRISPDLKLPADTVTSTVVVYGGKGMGKTNFGSVLVEELAAAKLRFSVIDPMGVWWGLRHSENGKGPGIEVLILGGVHGDIPIEPTAGAVVADLVVDEDASVVIDISRRPDGTMWSIGERVRFVTEYAKRLYQRQGEKRRPLMQLIDEAARFIPQIIRKGEEAVAACMGAIAVLVEEGRNVGIGCALITQRSARLNKDVAELADCMIAFRTPGPNSRRAVLDWLGEHVEKERLKEFDEKVRSLPRGTALVVSPGWLEFEGIVPIRMRETFDSSATPKSGQERRASGPGAKPDLAKYRDRMAATIEKAKAEDPRELKRRIAELEREKAAGGWVTSAAAKGLNAKDARIAELTEKLKAVPKRVEIPVLKDAHIERLAKVVERMGDVADKLATGAGGLRELAGEIVASVKRAAAPAVQAPSQRLTATFVQPARAPSPRPPADPAAAEGLRRGERKLLEVLARSHPAKRTRAQLATLAGFTASGGTFGTYMGVLKRGGFIEERNDLVEITDAGFAAIGESPSAPMTQAEVLETWRRSLRAGERKMLDYLVGMYPDSTSRGALAASTEFAVDGGTFSTYLGVLRRNGLVDVEGDQVRASETLFLGG